MTASLPPNEHERLLSLHRHQVLDTPPEAAFDRVTRLAAQLFQVPIALVSLVDRDRQWFKSCIGLDVRQTDRELSFCAHAILSDEVFVVLDATRDERFATNSLVTGDIGVRFYAGAPLKARDGFNLGSLCVIDTVPREWSEHQSLALADLASIVVDELELRQAARELQNEVAERKRNEERLRLLESVVVHANDAILITEVEPIDEPGPRILYVNEAFTRMSGYSPEEVLGKTPRMMHGRDTDTVARGAIRAALEKWRAVVVELVNYRKDGTPFWVELSMMPVADEKGTYTHWVSIQRDMTGRKQAEAALRAAKEEAERANAAKSEFLSRMSHELRTPMNAILGFAQLLEMDELNAEQRQGIEQILKGGRHLLALINEVLDVARIEAGQMSLSIEPVQVGEVAREVMALVQPLALERRVRFENNISLHSCHVLADRQRLRQALLNLFSNAVKYNREGGVVRLSCEPVQNRVQSRNQPEDQQDWVRFEIRDTGLGIAPADLERLFVPFERLGAQHTDVEGAGIGLSIAQRLVEVMGGTMGVHSIENEGSTFWIELPHADDPVHLFESSHAASPPTTAPRAEQADDDSGSAPPGRTILCIEDNLANLKLIERVLGRRRDVRLISAMQGRRGLELAREQKPDMILLDLHLPDMAGDEVLRHLRAHSATRDIPVVVLSADATPNQIERLKAAGAQEYLTKPLDVKQFMQVIQQTL